MCSSMCDEYTVSTVMLSNGIPLLTSQNRKRPCLSEAAQRSPTSVRRNSARRTGSGNQRTSRCAEASTPIQPGATYNGPDPRFSLTVPVAFLRGRTRAVILVKARNPASSTASIHPPSPGSYRGSASPSLSGSVPTPLALRRELKPGASRWTGHCRTRLASTRSLSNADRTPPRYAPSRRAAWRSYNGRPHPTSSDRRSSTSRLTRATPPQILISVRTVPRPGLALRTVYDDSVRPHATSPSHLSRCPSRALAAHACWPPLTRP